MDYRENLTVFNVAKGGKTCRMRIKRFDFLKCLRRNYEVFLVKNRKLFSVGKFRKYEGVFFRGKNVFIFSKAFFTKMGRLNFFQW